MPHTSVQKYQFVEQFSPSRRWNLTIIMIWVVSNKLNILFALLALMFAFLLSCGTFQATNQIKDDKLSHGINNIQYEISTSPMPLSFEVVNKRETNNNHKSDRSRCDDDHIDERIKLALKTYNADKIGMIDYALESSGGRIQILDDTIAYNRLWSAFLWNSLGLGGNNRPETILRPGNQLGDCFAFAGSVGSFRIILASPIYITAISVEHVPLETTKDIRSAPRHFDVFGRPQTNLRKAHKLGEFQYDIHGFNSIQTFKIPPTLDTYSQVEFYVKSNHGHPSYTCVYRFRVHGTEEYDGLA